MIFLLTQCEKSSLKQDTLTFDSIFVALYIDDAVWPNSQNYTKIMLNRSGVSYSIINSDSILMDKLSRYSVLLMPGGKPDIYAQNIGYEGFNKIREYVNCGGGYVGICGGAYIAVRHNIWRGWAGEPRQEEAYVNDLDLLMATADGPVEEFAPDYYEYPCQVWIADKQHPIASGLPDTISYLYDHGPMFTNIQDVSCTVFGKSVKGNRNFILCTEYGKGKVFLTSGHPEIDNTNVCISMIRNALKWCTNQED